LRGRSDVSDGLRARILEVIAEVGYVRPGSTTAVTAAHPQPLVDLVLAGVAGSWANRILIGVERAAVEAGVDLVVSVARGDDEGWLQRLLARDLGGAVLALVDMTGSRLAALQAARVPVVLLDPSRRPPSGVSSVGATNWAGGHAAAEHLLGLGHRELAVIGGFKSHLYSQARVDGFRSALAEVGIELASERIGYGDWATDDAEEVAAGFLGSPSRPTAIFACSDDMALGVYRAAAALDLRIPEDLSVVGFDDLPEAQWVSPALTTVHQPIAEMGEAALRLLLRMRSGSAAVDAREEMATRLIARASTAPPPLRTSTS